MKHYLTDTTFIAAFTLFSYFLFIQYEKGYLAAFGLADTVGIIPMQIQSIISSVFSVIMATVGLLFIMAVLVAMLRLITKNKSNKIKTASRLVTMLISPLILFYPVLSKLYVQDKKRFYIQMGAIIAEYVFLLIVLPIIRKKGGKDQVEDAIYSSTSIVGRILGKISENKNTKLYIAVSVIMITMLPLISYSFGYTTARGLDYRKTLYSDGQKYLVIRNYEKYCVLVKVSDNRVIPEYKIQFLETKGYTDFRVESMKDLNFTDVQKLVPQDI